ncbi:MAG: carboxylate--amine ligase [candidate division KSB1 bacterium]|nr:carboxylate--amine ligase [candidate division KSB1 bacterium]MDZ7276142.1 carboxylate--amine ligase [candidate division KSB1 bacterium]MDZ7287078.1 carboxylate--amine ligase [candidate division KSB1 bacterium]MDZ7296997.1 carboxylate--amine ligase [candidate division KSB1 bacterium]MDZ7306173.1 carboxylate--amine ligase [candidate division KSB1 bacterium]
MSAATTPLPHAIVIGLDCITGLQTARILARHHVPVIALAKEPAHYCCRTRVCERILAVNTATEELVQALETLGPRLPHPAVLFPCTDMSVLLLSRHRQQLDAWYRLALPPAETVEMLMDKQRFYTHAQQAGLPIPATFFLHNRAEAVAAAEQLRYPCILKPPLKTPRWERNTRAKVYKAANVAELLALYERCSPWAEVLMAQEWIAGSDAQLYSCNCYFNAQSEPLVTFVARKLRQWPPETGTSCLGEECRNDEVLQVTLQLFRSVNYHGLGYVEMKQEARTGRHYLIEPNIGRPTGRSAIAEAGGVELLYTAYCDMLGRPLPAQRTQTYRGVKWIYLRRDVQSAFHYWRRGELTLRDWWRSVRGPKGYAVFSWRDPLPFLSDLFRVFRLFPQRAHAAKQAVTAAPAPPPQPGPVGRIN